MDDFIDLLGRTQMKDGYIFTYNQVHFPAKRWYNLLIEHELYCHGHLIEAGVSHFEATGEKSALDIASRSADFWCGISLSQRRIKHPAMRKLKLHYFVYIE
jgi:DUF1680 family protein